jgi:hypothetical protein
MVAIPRQIVSSTVSYEGCLPSIEPECGRGRFVGNF